MLEAEQEINRQRGATRLTGFHVLMVDGYNRSFYFYGEVLPLFDLLVAMLWAVALAGR